MKLIKSVLRNRMSENTLDCIMRIVIKGLPVEVSPFDRAVQI